MFNKYADLYLEMTKMKSIIDESFYRVRVDDKSMRLKEKIEIIFYKKSVENFLLAPEKISIRKGTLLENLRSSLIDVVNEKLDSEGINPSSYDYMHIFCNDHDKHGVFYIKGEIKDTIVREICNIVMIGKTELETQEK